MVTVNTAADVPRCSDCLPINLPGRRAVLILTRTVSHHEGVRRWLVSLDSEVIGAINQQSHGWWGIEPVGKADCSDRYRSWRDAAAAATVTAIRVRQANEARARKAAAEPAGPSCRPALRLVWSAT